MNKFAPFNFTTAALQSVVHGPRRSPCLCFCLDPSYRSLSVCPSLFLSLFFCLCLSFTLLLYVSIFVSVSLYRPM